VITTALSRRSVCTTHATISKYTNRLKTYMSSILEGCCAFVTIWFQCDSCIWTPYLPSTNCFYYSLAFICECQKWYLYSNSICLTITLLYCVQKVKHIVIILSLPDNPITLVFSKLTRVKFLWGHTNGVLSMGGYWLIRYRILKTVQCRSVVDVSC